MLLSQTLHSPSSLFPEHIFGICLCPHTIIISRKIHFANSLEALSIFEEQVENIPPMN
jgi:hypothetical protein